MIKSDLVRAQILGSIQRLESELAFLKQQILSLESEPIDLKMSELCISSALRKSLALAEVIDLPIAQFVRQYSQRDVMQFRGFGQKKLFELINALSEIGYDWY